MKAKINLIENIRLQLFTSRPANIIFSPANATGSIPPVQVPQIPVFPIQVFKTQILPIQASLAQVLPISAVIVYTPLSAPLVLYH